MSVLAQDYIGYIGYILLVPLPKADSHTRLSDAYFYIWANSGTHTENVTGCEPTLEDNIQKKKAIFAHYSHKPKC